MTDTVIYSCRDKHVSHIRTNFHNIMDRGMTTLGKAAEVLYK